MDQFIGELMLVPWHLIPRFWLPCDGRLLPIQQNQALFSLIGNIYGGDGRNTFALPDLRGNVPVSVGPGFVLGQRGGSATVTLNRNQVPTHTHAVNVTLANAADPVPTNNYLATSPVANYQTATPTTMMNGGVVEPTGGQPHENRMPSLALTWVIATAGVFPSRT